MRACRNVEGPLGVRVCLPAAVGMIVAALFAPPATAQTASFPFTGGEQTYVVPPGFSTVAVTAVGGAGGSPPQGGGLPGGRGAIVSGRVLVTPGQVLYVWVGSSGGNPGGGFNGGAPGGMTFGFSAFGGGGASDVRTRSASDGVGSLESRLIVAGGGGGSAGIAASGGDGGNPGGCCGAAGTGPNTAQPGTDTAAGAGGCGVPEGCGQSGALGQGGAGGASGAGASARTGGGGGGGLYGGGGGAGHVDNTGGGAGGSSKLPSNGTVGLAERTTPTRVDITPVDTTPPAASLGGRGVQKLARSVTVNVRCGMDEDCSFDATGALSAPGAGRVLRLTPVERNVGAGRTATLRLRIPRRARAAAATALSRGKIVRVRVTVTAADSAGNKQTLKRTIRIRR